MKLEFTNWEEKYYEELNNNTAIIIRNSKNIDKKTMEGVEGSIFTPKFSVPLDQDSSLLYSIRNFSCECGNTYGKYYEGIVCSVCNTPVIEKHGGDVMKFGWIKLSHEPKNYNSFKILHPVAYRMLCDVIIGRNILPKILKKEVNRDLNGNIIEDNEIQKTKNGKYYNIGFIEFHKKFVEIVNYYAAIRGKEDDAKFIIEQHRKNKVFSGVIPVLNPLMRPASTSSNKKEFRFSDLNEMYIAIISNSKILENRTNNINIIDIVFILNEIQLELNKILQVINDFKFSKKTGFIKSNLLSFRCAFSSRMVIVPYVDTKEFKMNKIIISYKSFMKMYHFELMNLIMQMDKNITPFQVHSYLNNAFNSLEKNQTVINLCRLLIKNSPKEYGGPIVLINRNPTFELGSVQCMKIADIFESPSNTVMAIPLTSIVPLNADFDGDVLNVWSLKEKSVIEAFIKGFDPTSLLINYSDGGINSSFISDKDSIVAWSSYLAPSDDNINDNDNRSIKEIKIEKMNEIISNNFYNFSNGEMVESSDLYIDWNKTIDEQIENIDGIKLLKMESDDISLYNFGEKFKKGDIELYNTETTNLNVLEEKEKK